MKFEDFMIGMFMGGILGILVHNYVISKQPTAMDVYQDKTSLEYKVVDSVIVDSIVVFKKDNIDKKIK